MTRFLSFAVGVALLAGCNGSAAKAPPAPTTETGKQPAEAADGASKPVDGTGAKVPADMERGLLVALSQFEVGPDKKVLPKPGPAKLIIVTREGGEWKTQEIEDSDSNVFHKAFVYRPKGGEPGIVTLGGMGAHVKIWRKKDGKFTSETLWSKDFGGRWSRMRDAEIADFFGAGPTLAVATHDQGVVVTIAPKEGGWDVAELGAKKNTFVHEIEVGDMDGDGRMEVYATPSDPNKLDGSVQTGRVYRYVPGLEGDKETLVADLGHRHAKEILVTDMDGDGKDELYVAVEAHTERKDGRVRVVDPVEIRRYVQGTDPKSGEVIAEIRDRLCRFLTVGDVDGDGKKEMVVAPFSAGLWLLRPTAEGKWRKKRIDKKSGGFEHAAVLLDLDGDGKDEIYVASDNQGELRRYTWNGTGFDKEVILSREIPRSVFTWNIMPVPLSLVR
jgi:hypothetical protein